MFSQGISLSSKLNLERVGSMANKIYFSVFNPHWMASLKPVILDADGQHDAREIPDLYIQY